MNARKAALMSLAPFDKLRMSGRIALGAMVLAGAVAAGAAAGQAAEAITYRYDARGRLVKVERTGNVNEGVNTSYGYDKASNRTNKSVTGVP